MHQHISCGRVKQFLDPLPLTGEPGQSLKFSQYPLLECDFKSSWGSHKMIERTTAVPISLNSSAQFTARILSKKDWYTQTAACRAKAEQSRDIVEGVVGRCGNFVFDSYPFQSDDFSVLFEQSTISFWMLENEMNEMTACFVERELSEWWVPVLSTVELKWLDWTEQLTRVIGHDDKGVGESRSAMYEFGTSVKSVDRHRSGLVISSQHSVQTRQWP